jgi:hypothetical protein
VVASYVAIVYSWEDIGNFEYAGITLLKNRTYAFFTTVRDGVGFMSDGADWPGTRINLDLKPGDIVGMTLSLRNNTQALNVNGIEVDNNSAIGGTSKYVGMLYSRVNDVLFHHFGLQPGAG